MQRALLQFNNKRNWPLIREALKEAGREDLIGRGRECLVPEEQPDRPKNIKKHYIKRDNKKA
jgi:hypothetical protein